MKEVWSLTTTQERIPPRAHPQDNLICFANTYPLDNDLSYIKLWVWFLVDNGTILDPFHGHFNCLQLWASFLSEQKTLKAANNRPFPSSLVPLFHNESKCETFHMIMSSACSFIFMQIKVIFIKMVSHLDSLWNRGTRELGNGLLKCPEKEDKIVNITLKVSFILLAPLVNLKKGQFQFY